MKKKKQMSMKEREFEKFIEEVFGTLDENKILKRNNDFQIRVFKCARKNSSEKSSFLGDFLSYLVTFYQNRAKVMAALHQFLTTCVITGGPIIEFDESAVTQIHSNFPAFDFNVRPKKELCQGNMNLIYFGNGSGFLVDSFLITYFEETVRNASSLFYVEGFGAYRDIFFAAKITDETSFGDLCAGNFERTSFVWKDPQTKQTTEIVENPVWDKRMEEIMEGLLRRMLFYTIDKASCIEDSDSDLIRKKKKTVFAPTLKGVHFEYHAWPEDWQYLPVSQEADILKNGIFPYMGFFTEEQMMHRLSTSKDKLPSSPLKMREQDDDTSSLYSIYNVEGLQHWINHGTIYSISERAMRTLKERHSSASDFYDWAAIVKTLPFKDFFVIDELNRETFFVRCFDDCVCFEDLHQKCIWTSSFTDHVDIKAIPIHVVLIHLYLFYKKDPDIHAKTVVASGTDKKPEKPVEKIREGKTIPLTLPNLYEITDQSVRKVSEKEATVHCSWTMPRHVRTAHKHHFWVGTGEDRHLEERWLDDMVINKDLDPTINLHKIE